MIDELPEPSRERPDPRGMYVDGPLDVAGWPKAGGGTSVVTDEVDDGAPSWWRGDEEASQSFLRAMGIDPTTL